MICIAGKNEIALYGLNLLLKKEIPKGEIVALTNKTDDGIHKWQPSFKKYCNDKGIRIVEQKDLHKIKDLIFISLEYDQLIKTELFNSEKLYNIHFSHLPSYKGMYTSVYPILHGMKFSGVTLHKIDRGIDTGEIIDQIKFNLNFGTTGLELYYLYLSHSKELLKRNIDNILNNDIISRPQPILSASYFSKNSINFNNISVDFNKTCFEVCNQFNAFSFRPYQLLSFNGRAIAKAIPKNEKSFKKPGEILNESSFSFEVATIDYVISLIKDNLDSILNLAKENKVDILKKYYSSGVELDAKNKNGWNTLIVACYNGSMDVVKFLINKGISNVNCTNNNGTTALMYAMTYASKTNNTDILEFLIKNGANMHHLDYANKNVFHYAQNYGNHKVIKLLKDFSV